MSFTSYSSAPPFFCLKDYFIMLLVNYEFDRSTVKPYFFLDIFLRGNFLLTFAFLIESNYVDISRRVKYLTTYLR